MPSKGLSWFVGRHALQWLITGKKMTSLSPSTLNLNFEHICMVFVFKNILVPQEHGKFLTVFSSIGGSPFK